MISVRIEATAIARSEASCVARDQPGTCTDPEIFVVEGEMHLRVAGREIRLAGIEIARINEDARTNSLRDIARADMCGLHRRTQNKQPERGNCRERRRKSVGYAKIAPQLPTS